MYVQFIIAFFVTTRLNTYGSPVDYSVYETIKLSASNPNLKCPYLRSTKLLEPEPKFFSTCGSFKTVQSLTKLETDYIDEALCLLYYNNFEGLCLEESSKSDIIQALVSANQIDQTVTTYQTNVSQICGILKKNPYIVDTSKPGIEIIKKYIEEDKKCVRMCSDLDDNAKPICSVIAFMVNTTTILHNTGNVQTEKGMISKPHFTGHDANGESYSNEKLESQLSEKKQDLPSVRMPETPSQSSDGQGNARKSFNSADFAYQDVNSQQDGKVSSQLGEAAPSGSTNVGGVKAEKDIKQAEQKLPPSSLGVVGNIEQSTLAPHSNLEEHQVKTVNEVSNKNGEQTNLLPNSNSEVQPPVSNNANSAGKSSVSQKVEVVEESTGDNNKVSTTEKPNQNKNVDQSDGAKIEGGGNPPQVSAPLGNELQNEEDKNIQRIGEVKQNGGLPTKVEGVETAGESQKEVEETLGMPGDPEDEPEEDLALGNDDGEADEDDIKLVQPKSSEVKQKIVEKSKPPETDADDTSFPANYQNQNIDDSDSYFFSYFMMVCIMFICGYVAYHNKQKILALVVEGRKGRRPSRTRRPNSANYRKLDSNLEEAVTSSCNKNATQVIY